MRNQREIAEFLVVGYVQCWSMDKLAAVIGLDIRAADEAAFHELAKAAPFLSANKWRYLKRTPVRAFIETQYPKLARHLDANNKDPAKLLACAPQVMMLRCNEQKYAEIRSVEDRKEGAAIQKDAYRVAEANRIARTIQKSTQRGAWNVCKA